MAVGTIPAHNVDVGAEATVPAAGYFSDPDGDALTFSGSSSNDGIVTVSLDGATATVTGVARGSAVVTITAADAAGLQANQGFNVEVGQDGGQPATVTIFGLREVDDRTQAVDPSNVSGNISVLLDVQYNDETVTNVDLTLGEEVISCRGASSDAAAPAGVVPGVAESGGSVEIECFFDTDQVAGECMGMQMAPRFANGEHELGAQITTADGTVRQALATQMITLKNSNYVMIDHNAGKSIVVAGVPYYGGPTTEDNVNTFDVCPVAFDGTVVGAISLRAMTDTEDGNSLSFRAHRRGSTYGEYWGDPRRDSEAPFTFTAHSDWNGRNALSAGFGNDGGVEDINPAREGSGGHWIIQDGAISDPDGVDISSKFVPGDAENNLTKIGPIYFDFNAPRVTDASQVTVEGAPIDDEEGAYYSGKRGTYDGRSQRIGISNVSEGGSGGRWGTTSQVVAVGDCSISDNADKGEDGAGTAFQALVEDANTIGDLPEDDPYGDDLSDDGGVQCYTAELQSITDPMGNARDLSKVRIRSANNFGVDKTPPEIDNLVPDEELVLMDGAALTFEVNDPELETGERGSGFDGAARAYWGPNSSWSQRYFDTGHDEDEDGNLLPADPDIIMVAEDVVTISTNTGADTEPEKQRRYVVTAEVRDNAVPPNFTEVSFAYTRDSEPPGVSLSKSQSDIGNIGTATVTVGVGGTISDKNVIKTAELSIRDISAEGASCSDSANEMSQGRTGRVVRNKRDLENDTNEIVFDESFTIRAPGTGPETYCFWLEVADIAVDADGRGTGNRPANDGYELGSFSVGWPGMTTPPGPTFEFMNVDGTAIDDPIELLEGATQEYAVKLALANVETAPTAAAPLAVTVSAGAGATVNRQTLTWPTDVTDATADTLIVTLTATQDRDVMDEDGIAVTHSATGYDDASLMMKSLDDDVTLSVRKSSVTEGGETETFHVVATLTNAREVDANDPAANAVTVAWGFGGGTAVAGDFTATGVADIVISAGDMSDSVEVTLTGVDDVQIEGDETVNAQPNAASDAPFVVPATVTIMDDDPNVTLMVSPGTVNEGDDATTLSISATSTMAMPAPFDVVVTVPAPTSGAEEYNLNGGTAEVTVTLTIDTGDTQSNTMTVSLDPLEDDDTDDETIEITGPAAGVQIGGAGKTYSIKSVMVTIEDNDES
ncbi:MAG: hypothetical protein OXP36_04670 [Gammaproteobacteria bacterium]|nr:hypothetical protein [Gammaproteobacteria bacterium]